jgi:predicted DNA-binding transcriptional regulator AlpA
MEKGTMLSVELMGVLEAIHAEVKALREQTARPDKQWVGVQELAGVLGLSSKTIRNQLSAGTFPLKPRRVGGKVLFRLSDLELLPTE